MTTAEGTPKIVSFFPLISSSSSSKSAILSIEMHEERRQEEKAINEEKQINEEYKIWKKNSPFLYESVALLECF